MNLQVPSSTESINRWPILPANNWTLCVVLLAGCSAGQLERVDDAPLTEELVEQYNAEAARDTATSNQPQPVYTRYDLGKMSVVNLGVVVDASVIQLTGTTDTGWRIGTAAGGLNALNSGTTSTESIVLRVLGGALVGAAIESSLTAGQAFEYIIRRDDGILISTLNRSRLNAGDCLMIRTDPSNSKTLLEVKSADLCTWATQKSQSRDEYPQQDEIVSKSGMTQSQPQEELVQEPEYETQLIGRWCDKQVPSMPKYNGVLEIAISDSGEAEMHRAYGDGSIGSSKLIESPDGFYLVDGSSSGDKYRVIGSDGNLQLLDNEGLIRVATRLNNLPQPGECGF